jgi:fibronectin type 3 domain-containing protein
MERDNTMKYIITALLILVATTAFSASVSLQWDANTETDLAGYKVHFANYSGNEYQFTSLRPPIPTTATTYTVTGLDPLKKWFFRVTAINTSGMESAFSNAVNVNFIQSPKKARFTQVDIR